MKRVLYNNKEYEIVGSYTVDHITGYVLCDGLGKLINVSIHLCADCPKRYKTAELIPGKTYKWVKTQGKEFPNSNHYFILNKTFTTCASNVVPALIVGTPDICTFSMPDNEFEEVK